MVAKSAQKLEATKGHKRDIVDEYSNFDSKVYAPVTREGRLPLKNQVVDYSIPLIQSYVGLSNIKVPANISHLVMQKSVFSFGFASCLSFLTSVLSPPLLSSFFFLVLDRQSWFPNLSNPTKAKKLPLTLNI
jgi:hypothetical protein